MEKIIELETTARNLPAQYRELHLRTNEDVEKANELLKRIKALRKECDDSFDPIIDQTNKAHKEAIARKKKIEEPLLEGERIIKRLIGTYINEQEKIRAEMERVLRENARIEQEQKIMEMALEASNSGDLEMANHIIETPVYTPPVVVTSDLPKVDKRMFKKVWKWRLLDLRMIPREYLMVDSVKINGVIRSLKGDTRIPGIEVYEVSDE